MGQGGVRRAAALEEEKAAGPARPLRGVVGAGRQPLREGAEIQAGGRRVGRLAGGNYSPIRERGIGLALVDADAPLLDGDAVTSAARAPPGGHTCPAPVVAAPVEE